MNAKLTAETEADLLRGIEWFDRISLGLGDQFETEFYNALERIKQDPDLFAANHTGYRPCRLKRFTAVLCFAWSMAETAYNSVMSLAERHGIAVYDVSDSGGRIWRPGSDGRLAGSANRVEKSQNTS